jgi:hypothetical protein
MADLATSAPGVALNWTMMFGLVPEKNIFVRYSERITARLIFADHGHRCRDGGAARRRCEKMTDELRKPLRHAGSTLTKT